MNRGLIARLLGLFVALIVAVAPAVVFADREEGGRGRDTDTEVPIESEETEKPTKQRPFVTDIYPVPEDFLSLGPDGIEFASAMEMLTTMGVTFPKGSSASFDPGTLQLSVHNSPGQLEMVEACIESLRNKPELRVHVEALFLTANKPLLGLRESTGFVGDANAVYEVENEEELRAILEDSNIASSKVRDLSAVSFVVPEDEVTTLTAGQFEDLLSRAGSDGVVMSRIGGNGGYRTASSGLLLIQGDDRRIGISGAVVGADRYTVELQLISQGARVAGSIKHRLLDTTATIRDGHTIVVERKPAESVYEYDFVTARIVDDRGQPVNESESKSDPFAKDAVPEGTAGRGNDESGNPEEHDLSTLVYQVPPTFLSIGGGEFSSVDEGADPFAPAAEGDAELIVRPTARQILEAAGVFFPEGASAVYNPSTSQLIVRNTNSELELIEAYIQFIRSAGEVIVSLSTIFAESDDRLFEAGSLEGAGGVAVGSREKLLELLESRGGGDDLTGRSEQSRPTDPAAIFSEEQLQFALEHWQKRESWSMTRGSPVLLHSGQGNYLIAAGDRALGIVEVLVEADRKAVHVQLGVRGNAGEQLGRRQVSEVGVLLRDGHTVMFERALPHGRFQYDFVTVELKDPAGNDYQSRDETVIKSGVERIIDEQPAGDGSVNAPDQLSIEDIHRVQAADEAALHGNQQMADSDFFAARDSFLAALAALPDLPMCEDREQAYLQQFLEALRAAKQSGR